MTLEEVEKAIQQAHVPKYHVQATVYVQVVKPATIDVLVRGAAATPGLVELRRSERNLRFAIARAGGSSPAASGVVTVRRVREPETNITLDLQKPADLRIAMAMEPLEHGDIILEPTYVQYVQGKEMAEQEGGEFDQEGGEGGGEEIEEEGVPSEKELEAMLAEADQESMDEETGKSLSKAFLLDIAV